MNWALTDAIKLASNENPLGPSPKALAAIQADLSSLHRYPDSHAYYLKEDLAAQLGLSPAQLILGNGSDEVLDLLVRALVPARRRSPEHHPHLSDVRL